MKLEVKVGKSYKAAYYICMAMVIIASASLVMLKLIDVFNGNTFMLIFVILYACFPWLFYWMFKVGFYGNENKKNLKEIGTKVEGKIVDIEKNYNYKIHKSTYTLVVVYGEKITRVNHIYENEAFSLLQILLDEYPFNTVNSVPVDVYTHKNKAYVDLESADFTKMEEYEEAIKLLEDMKDDMSIKNK